MSSFKEGYDNFVRVNGANVGAVHGDVYVSNIENEIEKLREEIIALKDKKGNIKNDFLKGFAAEEWHEGTYNINSALEGKSVRINAPDDNGIADIFLPDGEKIQIKYYKTGGDSAKAQSISIYEHYKSNHPDSDLTPEQIAEIYNKKHGTDLSPHDPYYSGQIRLIPIEQMEKAKDFLEKQISKESITRPELAKKYQEALDNLTDRVKGDGVESIPLTEEESKELARLIKEGGFDPADFGISTEDLIDINYIMEQAFKAGLSAALVSLVLKVAPEICGIIYKLIQDGEIDADDFKRIGFAAVKGSADGYIRGTVAAALTISCRSGLLGSTLKAANPTVIGAVVALTMNTIQNACLMAFDKMNKFEFSERCAQDLIVTACALGMGYASAAALSTMFTPATAVIGYMIGSFVGSVIGVFVYKGVYSCVLSYCVDSGCTFFGLVGQDYTLPLDVLKKLGIKVVEAKKVVPKQITIKRIEPRKIVPKLIEPQRVSITVLRRGVIGVNCIGYA